MPKDCNSSCSTSGCRKIKECACGCGSLRALDFQLWEGCVDACNSNNMPSNADDYLCNQVGGETLYNYYGIYGKCGFNPENTAEFQANKAKNRTQNYAIIGLVVAIVLTFGFMIHKEFK